ISVKIYALRGSDLSGNQQIDNIVHALNAKIEAIGEDDKNFGDLIGTNIRTLYRNLGREVPEPARSCDAFVR
ncbi:hypothetical protein, partial [Devosia alba]|uniref:hypothetical protein n=1 Tax=Devosia alba TaxID=3152360 RepID=UPI00326316BB